MKLKQYFVLATFLSVASMLMTVGVCMYILTHPILVHSTSTAQRPTVQNDAIIKNYTATYPVFHSQKIDLTIQNYLKKQIDTFQMQLNGWENDPRNRLTVTYAFTHSGGRTASVVFQKVEQIVGRPEVRSLDRMTFDLKEQKPLQIGDVVKNGPDSREILATLLHDYFKQELSAQVTAPELVGLLGLRIDTLQQFSLDDDRLILYLNPHQLNDKENVVAIAIKKSLIARSLNEAYSSSDPNTKSITGEGPGISHQIEAQPKDGSAINPQEKMLALTFDDGPGALTMELLDTLNTYQADATFFVLGHSVQPYTPTLQRMVREGNEIGNHTWDHPNLRLLGLTQIQQQINDTQQTIRIATGGYLPRLSRPPGGHTSGVLSGFLQSQGLVETLWDIDTKDWRDRDVNVVYDRIISGAGDGRVILLHDIHPTSVQATRRAIPVLKAQGYQLVTVSQLRQYR